MEAKQKIKATQPAAQYYGGKWEQAAWICPILEAIPHTTFVDVCGGMGSIIINMVPSPVEVFNDLSPNVSNFFKVLRTRRDELISAVACTPYHRGDYWQAVKDLKSETDDLERARLFIMIARQSMAGALGRAWSCQRTHSRRGMASGNSRWLGTAAAIYAIADRFSQIQIENLPDSKITEAYDRPTTLFYFDPPYLPSTRSTKDVYQFEMTQEEHEAMLGRILKLQGSVAISGYASELYDKALKGWKRHKQRVPCRAAVSPKGTVAKNKHREEVLWVKQAQ